MRLLLKYLILFVFVVFVSCNRCGKEKKPKPVSLNITQKSDLFKEDLVKLTVDSVNNFLQIKLSFNYKNLEKFPFPKHQNTEPLTGTAFRFGIYKNGKLIDGAGLTHRKGLNYFGYNKWLGDNLSFSSDTLDFKNAQQIIFEIPFYAFHKLHEGEHEIELKIFQDMFCTPFKVSKLLRVDSLGDSTYTDTRNFIKSPLLWCNAKFKINVPAIFKSEMYGLGIELRNDSVFSPAGMDNTIWKSSYPDIYWTVDFPENNFYFSSDYIESTSVYDQKDTFYLFHYTPYDSIAIGVWDHDNLSRDDYIAYQNFSVNEFPNGKTIGVAFDNIKKMEMKMLKKGYINK